MGILTSLKSLFAARGVDVAARFEILRTAGCATMSAFYKARDRETGEIVGLKVIDLEKSAPFENMFRGLNKPSEGEIVSKVSHSGVVQALEYGTTTGGLPYLVMEYVDGTALNSMIVSRSAALTEHRVSLVRQAAEAVAAVHSAGFVHRDICPRNFVVAKDGTWIKLIDFGLSLPAVPKFLGRGDRSGVPRYLAPEILRQRGVDHRADIFAFGVTAYEMCALAHPWPTSDTCGEAALDHDTLTPVDLATACPDLEPRFAAGIMKCLSVNPDDRPESMDRFLRSIRGITDTPEGVRVEA
jgi:serine/threonine-protein kinase